MTETVIPNAVAFIGCGFIAHVHFRFLQKAGYKVDAVCDASRVRCELFAEQHAIEKQFTNTDDLFAVVKPRIVHILTPPHTHYQLIIMALKANCNVLVEKPLCQTFAEYQEIASLAEERGLIVTVDHTRVYNPVIIAARSRIKAGEFGKIVRMEYAYDDPSIIKSQTNSNGYRWAKGVPTWFAKVRGGVLTDLIPHPLSVFLSFDEGLLVKNVQSRVLPGAVIEELSVSMKSEDVNAQFFLSVNQRPLKNVFTIYCEKGSIQVDLRGMYSVFQLERRLPGIVSRAIVALSTAWQIASGFLVNVLKLLTGKAHTYDGLGEIITNFYGMVNAEKTGQVPLINAGRVMELVEEILCSALANADNIIELVDSRPEITTTSPADFLVLGGTGFIGTRVVNTLVDDGKTVRVLCRQSSNLKNIPKSVDICLGDIKDPASISRALFGVKTVIHCAAAMSGDWAEYYESTIIGTQNILNAIKESNVNKFIYISSIGLLDYNKLKNGQVVDESASVEPRTNDRGFYTRAKKEAEDLVIDFAKQYPGIATVILRPGLVYGAESNNNLQNAGVILGKYILVFGMGKRNLGLNYVQNLAETINWASGNPVPSGSIIHVVDSAQPSVKEIIKEHNRLSSDKIKPIYIPIFVWKIAFLLVDTLILFKQKKRGTFSYKFASNSKTLIFSNSALKQNIKFSDEINWKEAFMATYRTDK